MKRTMSLLLALALAAGLLAGCGASSGGTAASAPAVQEAGETYDSAAGTDAGLSGTDADRLAPQDGRKIIYNASLEMETEAFETTRDKLLQAAESAGAWVENSSEGGSADSATRWVNYTFRVPADNYAAFLNDASAAGSVTYKSESTDDVTADYVDLEARLESLRTQEARLLELAGQAGDLADLLAIEEQLAQVRYEIESYTGQQRVYDSLLAYSTVDVNLNEVRVLTPAADNFGTRVAAAFKGSWQGFVSGVQGVVIGLIYLLPLLVVAAVIALAVIGAVRLARRRRPKKLTPPPAVPPAGPAAPAGAEPSSSAPAPGEKPAPKYGPQQ